jgi:hypothetical protein
MRLEARDLILKWKLVWSRELVASPEPLENRGLDVSAIADRNEDRAEGGKAAFGESSLDDMSRLWLLRDKQNALSGSERLGNQIDDGLTLAGSWGTV